MRPAPILRRILALLLVPLLLLGAAAQGHTVFRCRYDGVARLSCCCNEAPPSQTETALSAGCCCDIDHVTVIAPTGTSDTHPRCAPPPYTITLLVFTRELLSTATRSPWSDQRERSQGPPLILVKHSLLI